MDIAIVTDSTADIPPALAEQHNIHVVPAILTIEGQSMEDGKGISRREFYERMPYMQTPPTTATPSAGTFQQVYERLFQQGCQSIISIHVASLLSGICNTAHVAAQSFGERVRVIDSGQLSLGLGYQALAAAESAAQGFPLNKVLQHIENVRQRVRVVAMLDTLEYLHRSGRVSWARARIGSLLRIKPFIEVKEGQALNIGQTRTRRNGIPRLMGLLYKMGSLEQLAILHTNAEADARQILANLNITLPAPPLVVNVTTIVGTHIGPNGLGFAAVVT
ncbi:MAG: DegV family protein [Chloroflexi bacterium]|nr:DegV family protein [Chloroflexota bacterium]